MKFKKLLINQLDDGFKDWSKIKQKPFPAKGWINLIRTALGLSSYDFAARMGLSQSRAIQIERAEQDHTATLHTLEKAAEAMGCELVYAVVPKTTLKDILVEQAEKVARKRITRVAHSMGLEAQKVEQAKTRAQFGELVKELLEGSPKKLWKDE